MLERKKESVFIIFPVKSGKHWTEFSKWNLLNLDVSDTPEVLLILLKLNETVV